MTEVLGEEAVRLERLEKLFQSTRQMMSDLGTTELEAQLQRIADAARDVLQAEACGIFLVKDTEDGHGKELCLEASTGHREDGYNRGMRLPIVSREGGGLTSHIAYEGKLFNERGEKLNKHVAVNRNHSPGQHHTKEPCYSLLALPLWKTTHDGKEMVGLLRVDNKHGEDGRSIDLAGFVNVDEWLIRHFADSAVVAIENAELMHYRKSLIGSCPNGIIAVDRKGRVTEYNAHAEQILGRPRQDVIDKPVADLYFDPAEPARIGLLLRENGGRVISRPTQVKGPSGEAIPILHSAIWLESGGRRTGSVGYFEDLRPKQRNEQREQLLQAINVVAQADDLEAGLQQFTELMTLLLDRSYCAVLLFDEADDFLFLRAASRSDLPEWKPAAGTRISVADWPILKELRVDALLAYGDERHRPLLQRLSKMVGFDRHLQSLKIEPLRIENRVIGHLHLGERRRDARNPFDAKEENELVATVAAQVAVLMDRLRFVEQTRQRENRLLHLARVAPQLGAQAETAALLKQTAGAAAELVDYDAAGVFLRYLTTERLELMAVAGLPESLIGIQADAEQVIGKAAASGEARKAPSLLLAGATERKDLGQTIAVPLRSSGVVEGVLFVANKKRPEAFDAIDQDVLERLASHATMALQTSRLLGDEHRLAGRLEVLHRISNYVLQSDDDDRLFHAVLTGVTAGYGLRFNRAFLFLLDDSKRYLVGKRGIGELDSAKANAAWKKDDEERLNDFGRYLKDLEQGKIKFSTADDLIKGLHFETSGIDVFAEVARTSEPRVVEPHDFFRIPEIFRNLFAVTSSLVLSPLVTKNGVLGILVVDNKFTQAAIEPTVLSALSSFASTAAIAIENRNRVKQSLIGQNQLLSFYTMSAGLQTLDDPDEILRTIVNHTYQVAEAWGVSLLLYDERTGRFSNPIPVGADREVEPQEVIRRDSRTMEVMQTGKAMRIEDVGHHDTSINPTMLQRGIKAALGLPLSLPNKKFGVMWIHYDRPRRFPDSLVAALQLFVNQAAVAYDQAKRIKVLERIREAADWLIGSETVTGVLERTVESARRIFEAEAAILWLYDQGGKRFLHERSVQQGLEPSVWDELRAVGPMEMEATRQAMREGSVAVTDVTVAGQERDVLDERTLTLMSRMSARGFLAVALNVGTEDLGVLWTFYKQPFTFGDDQELMVEEFANHAAWSLKKARLLERVTRAKAAAKVVAEVAATGTGRRTADETLTMIAQQAMEALGCGAVVLFENRERGLKHPPATAGLRDLAGLLDPREQEDYDLVESILKRDTPRTVPKVADEDDFKDRKFVHREGIRSVAATPLLAAGARVGVMFVNYRVDHDFTEDEVADIQLFANQAAVAIHAGQLIEALNKKIEELGGARALANFAWIGLMTSEWYHAVANDIAAIEPDIRSLERDLRDAQREDLRQNVEEIWRRVKTIGQRRRKDQYERREEKIFELQELRPRFRKSLSEKDLSDIDVADDFDVSEPLFVKAIDEWLIAVLEHLLKNAVNALTGADYPKKVTVSLRRNGDNAEICFEDNGPGIPPEILAQISNDLPVDNSTGLGIGLLIARGIMRNFGGSVEVNNVQPHGASIVLSLPLAMTTSQEPIHA